MTIKIELGKRYVRRDGKVVGPIIYCDWPFEDSETGMTYTLCGSYDDIETESPYDLVEEVTND